MVADMNDPATRRIVEGEFVDPPQPRRCDCGSGEVPVWEYDGQNIALCTVCPECRDEKLKRYRPEILGSYTQADVDEPIEPED